jgi:hypothetical protein
VSQKKKPDLQQEQIPEQVPELSHYQKVQNKFNEAFAGISEYENIVLSKNAPDSETYSIYLPSNYVKYPSSESVTAYFDPETEFSFVVAMKTDSDTIGEVQWLENVGKSFSESLNMEIMVDDWEKEDGPFDDILLCSKLAPNAMRLWAIKDANKVAVVQVYGAPELLENEMKFARFIIRNMVFQKNTDSI